MVYTGAWVRRPWSAPDGIAGQRAAFPLPQTKLQSPWQWDNQKNGSGLGEDVLPCFLRGLWHFTVQSVCCAEYCTLLRGRQARRDARRVPTFANVRTRKRSAAHKSCLYLNHASAAACGGWGGRSGCAGNCTGKLGFAGRQRAGGGMVSGGGDAGGRPWQQDMVPHGEPWHLAPYQRLDGGCGGARASSGRRGGRAAAAAAPRAGPLPPRRA